jgi:predicted DNA-binding transcriptional regulator AlpA
MNSSAPLNAYRPTDALASLVMSVTLAGLAEVAEICGCSKRTAANYVQRSDFPAPVDRLKSGPVWRRAAVERWKETHLPLQTGRPPKAKRRRS